VSASLISYLKRSVFLAMATQASSQKSTGMHNNLLKSKAPVNCSSALIDFSKTPLPEYSNAFAVFIHNLLTPEECAAFLNAAQATTADKWEQAMINIGGGEQMLLTDSRNCGRIIWDHPELASRLFDRILPHLPQEILVLKNQPNITGNGPAKRNEIWRIKRLNERLRFLKYTSGMYFKEHMDGSYVTPDGKEVSFLTVHLYLNGDPPSITSKPAQPKKNGPEEAPIDERPLQGGSTRFFSNVFVSSRYFDVLPETGACLVFQHRHLIHSGEDVLQGTKFTMRTDIMYEKVAE